GSAFGFNHLALYDGSARNGEDAPLVNVGGGGAFEGRSALDLVGVERLTQAYAQQGSSGNGNRAAGGRRSLVIARLRRRIISALRGGLVLRACSVRRRGRSLLVNLIGRWWRRHLRLRLRG